MEKSGMNVCCDGGNVHAIYHIANTSIDKSRIVEEGNYHKFTKSKNDPGMAKKLFDTGDRELVEVRLF